MAKTAAFQKHVTRYEEWFEKNRWAYVAELKAVGMLLPKTGRGLEVGVGTGRFAAPLGIETGVEPAAKMARVARSRGIRVVRGVAEQLPLGTATRDYLLLVTTLCFVDDLLKTFIEASRVLIRGGYCLAALVNRDSPLGMEYEKQRHKSIFYKEATFYSVETIVAVMGQVGFRDFCFTQTLFSDPADITATEPVEPGYGRGSFVVIRGRNNGQAP